jgi:putative addiction module CopG family antidote
MPQGGGEMAPTPTLNVSLTPHLVRLIEGFLSSGRYQSASEIVRAGLRLLIRPESEGRLRNAGRKVEHKMPKQTERLRNG